MRSRSSTSHGSFQIKCKILGSTLFSNEQASRPGKQTNNRFQWNSIEIFWRLQRCWEELDLFMNVHIKRGSDISKSIEGGRERVGVAIYLRAALRCLFLVVSLLGTKSHGGNRCTHPHALGQSGNSLRGRPVVFFSSSRHSLFLASNTESSLQTLTITATLPNGSLGSERRIDLLLFSSGTDVCSCEGLSLLSFLASPFVHTFVIHGENFLAGSLPLATFTTSNRRDRVQTPLARMECIAQPFVPSVQHSTVTPNGGGNIPLGSTML